LDVGFPFPLNTDMLRGSNHYFLWQNLDSMNQPQSLQGTYLPEGMAQSGVFAGHDVLLGHVMSFDVKVYDPFARVVPDVNVATNGVQLEPGDAGYVPAYAAEASSSPPFANSLLGAYVDLGYGRYTSGALPSRNFSGVPWAKSQLNPNNFPGIGGFTFCTWSSHYERDGVDEDGDGLYDEGTDGLDNDGNNGVDDGGTFGVGNGTELETSPPYPFPLRSLQIKIRVLDIKTQNVRQITVEHDFLRE
jgi:hypothetical protein